MLLLLLRVQLFNFMHMKEVQVVKETNFTDDNKDYTCFCCCYALPAWEASCLYAYQLYLNQKLPSCCISDVQSVKLSRKSCIMRVESL